MNFIHTYAAFDRFKNGKQAMIIHIFQPFDHGHIAVRLAIERIHANLRAANRLHQRHFEARRDRHNLARRLHLRAQLAARTGKFIKRPLRELDHHIIQRGFKAGAGLAGDFVFDFIQRIAERDARGDLGDGIAGRLARQRR